MRTLLFALLLSSCDSKDGDSVSATDDSSTGGDDSSPATDLDGDGVAAPDDCDDDDDSIHPGADEVIADGTDQDCDGNDLCYTDADGDGFGSGTTVAAPTCKDKGVASTSTDCGDGDATIRPGAAEIAADGIDQDCDGGDVCFVDADGDGFGSPLTVTSSDVDCSDAGESGTADDCLDAGKDAPETFPGSAELDSKTDCMTDADGDGYGSSLPAKGVTPGTDCNDVDDEPCDEFHVGNDKEFSSSSSHSPDYLLGSRLDVKTPMTVTHLALIGKASGPNVRMALYTDAKGPDALVVEAPETAMAVGVLEMEVDPTPIDAGYYWIMAIYDTTASVGIAFPSSGGVVQYRSLDFADPMPDPFGSVTTYTGQVFNYYIVGY
jgi:hypothetical protein